MTQSPFGHKVRITCLICGISVTAIATGETLDDYSMVLAQTDKPGFIVAYADGSVERYRPAVVARLSVHREQQGETSRPLEGKFIDTRECRWQIRGVVDRQLYLCTKFGCDSAQVQPSERLPDPSASKSIIADREPPSLAARVARLQPDPCPETEGEFRAAVERIRTELVALYHREVAAGREAIAKLLGALPGVEAVTEEER